MKAIRIGSGKVYQPKREPWKGPSVKLKKKKKTKNKHHLFYYVTSSFKLRKKASLRLEEMAEPRGKVMANESSKKVYKSKQSAYWKHLKESASKGISKWPAKKEKEHIIGY